MTLVAPSLSGLEFLSTSSRGTMPLLLEGERVFFPSRCKMRIRRQCSLMILYFLAVPLSFFVLRLRSSLTTAFPWGISPLRLGGAGRALFAPFSTATPPALISHSACSSPLPVYAGWARWPRLAWWKGNLGALGRSWAWGYSHPPFIPFPTLRYREGLVITAEPVNFLLDVVHPLLRHPGVVMEVSIAEFVP